MDGECGRCFCLADHVLGHTGVWSYISWGQTTDLQGVVLKNLISGLKQAFMFQLLLHKNVVFTDSFRATIISRWQRQKRAELQTKVGIGWGRKVMYDERAPVDESYLPLGRSPSSFLQRTVGTGSPRASHLNSTLWSTNTTWLLGRRTKLGRSLGIKTQIKNDRTHDRRTGLMF